MKKELSYKEYAELEKMAENAPKLKLEDIKVGMIIFPQQLSNIYNTAILLTHDNTPELKGRIIFIGDPQSQEYIDAWNKVTSTEVVYNDANAIPFEGIDYYG